MTTSSPHILIVEDEFLIALDAEYLIATSLKCRISLLRPEQLDELGDEALRDYTLCLLDVPLDPKHAIARARRLRAAGVDIVFTTVSEAHRHGVDGVADAIVVMKPFDSDILLATVTRTADR